MMRSAARVLFVLLAIAVGAIFLFHVYAGYVTWERGYLSAEFGLEHVFAGFVLILFAPGAGPFLAALYFFVYLRDPVLNLIGLVVTSLIVVVHFFAMVPALHSGAYGAFAIGCVELAVVAIGLRLFHRYVVD